MFEYGLRGEGEGERLLSRGTGSLVDVVGVRCVIVGLIGSGSSGMLWLLTLEVYS